MDRSSRVIDASIGWAAADAGTQFVIRDSSALEKQLPIFGQNFILEVQALGAGDQPIFIGRLKSFAARNIEFDVITICYWESRIPSELQMYNTIVSELEELHKELSNTHVRNWRLQTIIPMGRVKETPELQISEENFLELSKFIQKQNSKASHDAPKIICYEVIP